MSQFLKTKPEIMQWLYDVGIENYTINEDLTVDVDDNVNFLNNELENIPIQFGIINGNFSISGHSLTSLKGSPYKVNGYFDCSYNNIQSLKYCPREIGGVFFCSHNFIKSLQDGPEIVHGKFKCYGNPIESLNKFITQLHDDFEHDIDSLTNAILGFKEMYSLIKSYDADNYVLILTPHQIASFQMQQELSSELPTNKDIIKKNKL
jgi:hypothetical protein